MNGPVAALLLAAGLAAGAVVAADLPVEDEAPPSGRYLLMDANGRAVTNADFPGKFQLVAFGYTYCPDICPTTLVEAAAIMKQLGDRAERVQPLFITVDPERDTPQVLAAYTAYFHPRIIGLTGSPALVARAAQNFNARYEKVTEPGAPPDRYHVDHSAGMYLLGPDGSYIRKFGYSTPAAEIAERIERLLDETRTFVP
jgi:cytochrome oxidase Cu insertion factor (SCO1/SenC/PrrC family)